MSDPAARSLLVAVQTAGARRVAECLADLARSLTLYPENNVQVKRALASFLEAMREEIASGPKPVEVRFARGTTDSSDAPSGRGPDWLKDRFDRADLTAVAFSESADESSVLSFVRRLLELYRRPNLDTAFAALWPDSYGGITLFERRFDGTFSEEPQPEGVDSGPSVEGGPHKQGLTLKDALKQDPRICDRIASIQAKLVASARSETEVSRLDVISEIVRLLPAEGLRDFDAAVAVTDRILASLETRLTEDDVRQALGRSDQDGLFRRFLFQVSRSHFVLERGARSAAPPPAPAAPGDRPAVKFALREEDAAIQDDLNALLAERDALGPLATAPLRAQDVEDPAEELGVLFHMLVTTDDWTRLPNLKEAIGKIVASSREVAVTIAGHYVAPSQPERLRVAGFLRRSGFRDLLSDCGPLGAAGAVREFPQHFLRYLSSLDLGEPEDAFELDSVCAKIGPQRFKSAGPLLTGAENVLDEALVQQLFHLPFISIGPLVREIYERDVRRHLIDFMRYLERATPNRIDKEIIEVIESVQFLRSEYLGAVAENDTEKLERQRPAVVRSCLAVTEGMPQRLTQHVRAIRLFRYFDYPESFAQLDRIVHERKFGVLRKHPRIARRAAANVLRELQGRRVSSRV